VHAAVEVQLAACTWNNAIHSYLKLRKLTLMGFLLEIYNINKIKV